LKVLNSLERFAANMRGRGNVNNFQMDGEGCLNIAIAGIPALKKICGPNKGTNFS
jgi:hypothetical protein